MKFGVVKKGVDVDFLCVWMMRSPFDPVSPDDTANMKNEEKGK